MVIRFLVSLCNLSVVLLLTRLYGHEYVGRVLADLSVITFISTVSRLGWDHAIQSKDSAFIYGLNIILSSVFGGVIVIILFRNHAFLGFNFHSFACLLSLNLQANFDAVSRLVESRSTMFYFVLGLPMLGLAIAFFCLGEQSSPKILLFTLLFNNLATCITLMVIEKGVRICFRPFAFTSGLKSFPIALHGLINQNLLQLSLGQIGAYSVIPGTVVCQRFLGIMTWPINKYQFTRVEDIRNGRLFWSEPGSVKLVVAIGSVGASVSLVYCALTAPNLVWGILALAVSTFIASIRGDYFNYKIYNKLYVGAFIKQGACLVLAALIVRYGTGVGPFAVFLIYAAYTISLCF